jgi:predicted amidophosphoribosyltransferase
MIRAQLSEFGPEELEDHHHLNATDDCHFYLEYTSRRGFAYSDTNAFILNLKKKMSTRGTYQWAHKQKAIRDAGQLLGSTLQQDWVRNSTFVPIPPSKARNHPEYDPRMTQIVNAVGDLDVRELIIQTESLEATHHLEDRHTIQGLLRVYEIDEDLANPAPSHIILVDDVVTGGTHFKAAKLLLQGRFRGVPVSGVFLARRVFPDDDE